MKKVVRLTENDLMRIVKRVINEEKPKKIQEFFDSEGNNRGQSSYFKKMSSELGKFIMLSVSTIGREKTAELLSSTAEMINNSENTSTLPKSLGRDYQNLDITSDIMDYLNNEFDIISGLPKQ